MNDHDDQYVWLTDLTRQFMEKDYLVGGESVSGRASVIAGTAERILNKPGFAERFKDNLKKGWYSLSTPIWTNFGTDRGLPISCVTGDTWINTKVGGGKQARDIEIGDEVLTHRGRYRKVATITPTAGRADIYRLKVSGRMTNLYLTGDHLVLTNLGWVRADALNPAKHLVAINDALESAENSHVIDMRDYIDWQTVEKDGRLFKAGSKRVRKDRQVEVVSYCAATFAKVPVDADLAWATGMWFAEGSIAFGKDKKPNGIRITTNDKDEKELARKWLSVMSEKFGVQGKGYDSTIERGGKLNSWHTVNLNSKAVGNLFASFGVGCKNKLIPQWMIESPKNVLEAFLDGILAGDGSVRKNGTIKITLANPKLILQVYQIGLALGRSMSLQMQEKSGKLATTKYVYTIVFRDTKLGHNRFSGNAAVRFSDGLSYAPIRVLEKTNKVEDVFDFGVEEDHSFSAAGVVLHNCFGSYIPDSMTGIAQTCAEVMTMTKYGGGTSGTFDALRPRGSIIKNNGESAGAVHFMQLFDKIISVVSQGSTRRGNFSPYLSLGHKDILEFLKIRTEGNAIQDLSPGVCVPEGWMEEMIAGNKAYRHIWAKVIESRFNTGYPYVVFLDNANKYAADVYVQKNMRIKHSNLCTEIFLPDDETESFVCDLSSMNILHYDAWKDTDAVELLVYFLDAVMSEFIDKARNVVYMERPVRFAERHRALGVGWVGWHSYLQSRMIPYESMQAKLVNTEIIRNMRKAAYEASAKLAKEYGEPELLKGFGRRNTTLLAIAPTKSSSFILGQVSESTELNRSNYYIKDLAKGKFTIKNRYLEELLEAKGRNDQVTWEAILLNSGSVKGLDCLDEYEKSVFKTFNEVSPMEVIIQASQRQKYIDQGQSLNLVIHPDTPVKEVNKLMIEAWRLGIKSLYYQISMNAAQKLSRSILSCASCES